MPLIAWGTYVKWLPQHVGDDAMRLVAASAFPYMEKDGRERFLQELQGAGRKGEPERRKMSKGEYEMHLAAMGIPLIQAGGEGESKPDA